MRGGISRIVPRRDFIGIVGLGLVNLFGMGDKELLANSQPTAPVSSREPYVRLGTSNESYDILKELESKGREQRRELIEDYLKSNGMDYFLHRYSVREQQSNGWNQGANIVIPPSGKDLELIVGCHYDIVEGTPGADDNTSSVAVLLNFARQFKDAKNLGVRYIFFDQEEDGLIGSTAYSNQIPVGNAIGFYNLEGTGVGDSVLIWGAREGSRLIEPLVQQTKEAGLESYSIRDAPIIFGADHFPFSEKGVDALTFGLTYKSDIEAYYRLIEDAHRLTQDEFMKGIGKIVENSDKYSHIHQPTDRSANVDPDNLNRVGDILYRTITAIDSGISK